MAFLVVFCVLGLMFWWTYIKAGLPALIRYRIEY